MGPPYAERHLGLVRAHEKAMTAAMGSLTADDVRSYSKEYIQKVEALPESKRAKFLDPMALIEGILPDIVQKTTGEFVNICSKYNVNDKLLELEKALKSEKVNALGKGGENIEDDAIIPPMSTEQIVGVLRSRTMPPRCKERARLEREVIDAEAQVAILEHKLKQTRGHVERKLNDMRETLSEMKAMEELLEVGQ